MLVGLAIRDDNDLGFGFSRSTADILLNRFRSFDRHDLQPIFLGVGFITYRPLLKVAQIIRRLLLAPPFRQSLFKKGFRQFFGSQSKRNRAR
jgi:hypothetical protein